MKVGDLIYLLVSVLTCVACTSDDFIANRSGETSLQSEEPLIYTIDTTLSTADLAEKIALEYPIQSVNSRSLTDRIIKERLTIDDDNGNPVMYIFNYQNNTGYIITSATQDYAPVLAYSNTGNFDVTAIGGQPVEIWIEQEKVNISTVQEAADSIKYKFRMQWLPYTLAPTPLSQIITTKGSYDEVRDFVISNSREWVSQGYQPIALGAFNSQYASYYVSDGLRNTIVSDAASRGTDEYGGIDRTCFVLVKQADRNTNIGPLTTSTWNQVAGFNNYIPSKYPVGCTAVAIGQIMKFWQYPTSFNWNQITDKYSDATALFLYQVAEACGMTYGPTGSSAYNTDVLKMLHDYNYSNAQLVTHNVDKVISNLITKKPVYMSGDRLLSDNSYKGHAWVCDGLKQSISGYEIVLKALQSKTSFFSYNYGKVYNEAYPANYLSMNWGYSGSYNGFFLDNNIKFSDRDYKFDRQDIIDIYY